MEFVQLQVKSSYTLLESTITIDHLLASAKERGYEAIALTDRNVLYGALEFYQKAKEKDIKPIIGLTLDVQSVGNTEFSYPLIFLAKNIEGYKQLIKLSSQYMTQKNPVSLEFISKNQSDLTVVTPGSEGELESLFISEQESAAEEVFASYNECFNDFYVGIQLDDKFNMIKEQLLNLDTEFVALGNIQYIDKEDAFANEVLQNIKNNTELDIDTKPMEDYSLSSDKTMKNLFVEEGLDFAVENTLKIAEKINLELKLNAQLLPKFPIPEEYETDDYLEKLCLSGLNEKIIDPPSEYYERLDKELKVISKMGFSDYFLIVWDVMKYAHDQDIVTGAGRGSAAASLVAYSLDITKVDPIKYNLLFERFLNKDRYTMPDIDLDFPDNKRDQILEYVNDKYGSGHVAQIATFGTYAAKMSVRDAGRVFGLETSQLKRWSEAIPSKLKITLEEAYNESEGLRSLISESEKNKHIFETARRIEGLPKHISTHAAGVVISDRPLIEYIPLEEGNGKLMLTQFAMDDVETSGLLKMDFLALKNLTILADCIHYSQYENTGKTVQLNDIPLHDDKTLNIFRQGDTNGVFQFESDGIKRVLKRISPNSFEDIVAVNALYRPGPMEQIDSFIKRKKGQEKIVYPHQDLQDILEVTYGVMVYQEQVMKVASKMAGYSLSEADQLRRTMSKKIQEEMIAGREKFVNGAIKRGYTKEEANNVYDYIDRFANYGFNRAHAVAYSVVAFQLAYFKAHFPKSFFASLLKNYSNNKKKTKIFSSEAKENNIKFLGPDINQSDYTYKVKKSGIQFGLKEVKGTNKKFIQEIISERKNSNSYQDLVDFTERLIDFISKPENIYPLIYAGAFDNISWNRATAINSAENIFESIQKSGGNIELFELTKPRIQKVEELSLEEKLNQEYEYTGFYFSEHPSTKYNYLRKGYDVTYINKVEVDKNYSLLGSIRSIKTIQTKKGIPMSFIELSDDTGTISLTLFPAEHRKFIQKLAENEIVLAEGKIELYKNEPQMIINKIVLAKELEANKKVLYLRFASIKEQNTAFQNIQNVLRRFSGNIPVIVYDSKTKKHFQLKEEYSINENQYLLRELRSLLGTDSVVLK